jgi:TolB protein
VEEGIWLGPEILFSSDMDGSFDVWGINLDGTGRVNLSRVSQDPDGIYEDVGGEWSPDGSKILFRSNKGPVPYKTYIMDADGSNAHALTSNAYTEIDPTWGADGTKVYYGRNSAYPTTTGAGCTPCPFWEIYEYDLTTGQETRLTSNSSRDEMAVASPDGRFIAFRRGERSNDCCNATNLWVMDADGGNQRQLSPSNGLYESAFDWDPISNRILTYWNSGSDLVLMDIEGNTEHLATGVGVGAAFSPDGSKILLSRNRDMYIFDIDTRQVTPFLVEPGAQDASDWGPPSNVYTIAR